ncbi:unnamed protein product [Macrosiphum euphorbiae]|uniref:Uncharacterized protein n=1 Tax=Macrosiphum euphorbiae TaxID=13131 RepID=A0AAV0VVP9_9HEMI|nr:unnamed protein product [Macrosiphum euphorbiae]
MARGLFSLVGMQIHPSKSHAVNVVNGNIMAKAITLLDSSVIPSLGDNDLIKYMVINFKDEIIFDQNEFLIHIEKVFRNLVTSPLLRSDQKLNILNQYDYPKLIFPLQKTPVDLLQQSFLECVDMLVRLSVREICGLPADTLIRVFYNNRKVSDLGMLSTFWEASLQHLTVAQRLSRINYQHLKAVRDLPDEIAKCRLRLGNVIGENAQELLEGEFNKWKQLSQRGIGVLWYDKYTLTNAWVSNKGGLSSGEWTNAIKASINSMSNHGTGGRSVSGSRHCRNEVYIVESIPHIRGACPKTELVRNAARHHFRSAIADLF